MHLLKALFVALFAVVAVVFGAVTAAVVAAVVLLVTFVRRLLPASKVPIHPQPGSRYRRSKSSDADVIEVTATEVNR